VDWSTEAINRLSAVRVELDQLAARL
jgi:hypothetical protein